MSRLQRRGIKLKRRSETGVAKDTGDEPGIEQRLKEERLHQLGNQAAEGMLGPNPVVGLSRRDILSSAAVLFREGVKNPRAVLSHGRNLASELARVATGKSQVAPARSDRRFSDAAWQGNPLYKRAMQAYLAACGEMAEWLNASGLGEADRMRGHFLLELLTSAAAPSNSPLHPAAIKRLVDTGGGSLASGLRNFIGDLERNGGMPSMVDKAAFKVGGNLATSEGAVVLRNDLLELIQYTPRKERVFERPMLMVPPQINKFYVYDLTPEKSMVRYLLEQGYQVFMVSWYNPTRDFSHWGLDRYVEALMEAIDAVLEISGSDDCNVTGACSGGVTTLALLGHLAALGDRRISALTLLVAVFDTYTESQLGMFASDATIELARRRSASKGVLDGTEMSRVFAWMRPNDLVWNYWVNNYLLGHAPPTFDVLYWNADSTRLPARFHSELLDLFKHNPMVEAGGMTVCGTPIDLGQIESDSFMVAGVTDHITPWKACYRSSRLLGGEREFVLSSSGHVQSILQTPGNPKSRYFLNVDYPEDAADWLAEAREHDGSWWEHWANWLSKRSHGLRPAPDTLGSKKHPPGARAPGNYVFG